MTTAAQKILGDTILLFSKECCGEAEASSTSRAIALQPGFLQKAKFALEWVLKQAHVDLDAARLDEGDFVNSMACRFRRLQGLQDDYIRLFLAGHVGGDEDGAAGGGLQPGSLEICQVPYRELGHVHMVLSYSEKLVRCAHVLTRLLEDKEDQFFKDHLLDPLVSFQEKRFIQVWQRAYDLEEGLPCEKEKEHRKVIQILMEHCLDQALVNKYRRYDGYVFQEIKVECNGKFYGTRAFQRVSWPDVDPLKEQGDMKEFVTRACDKDRFPRMWELSLDPTVRNKVVENLTTGIEREFPRLVRRRNLLSFRNGIFDTAAGEMGTFHPYAYLAESTLNPSFASAKFFDLMVEPTWLSSAGDWFYSIPTPKFQSILDYQNLGRKRPAAQPQGGERGAMDMDVDGQQESGTSRAESMRIKLNRLICSCLETCYTSIENSTNAETEQGQIEPLEKLPELCEMLKTQIDGLKGELLTELEGTGRGPSQQQQASDLSLEGQSQEYRDEKTGKGRYDEPGNALPLEVQRWMYIFLGRLLHELNRFDHWQIMPFLKGRAGTGKSAIGDIVQRFFEPEQVGILSSNIESTFGLSAIADKFIMLCLEVKKEFRLNQGEFQSLVSGEMCSLAVKNKKAYQKKWTAPGLLCGNEWAGYQDTQGSIARRLAVVNFKFPISAADSNPNLTKEIVAEELAALIVKCNIAYRQQAYTKKGQDIWNILPDYFKYQRRILQVDTDPIWATIFDPSIFKIEAGDKSFVSLDEFMNEYKLKWELLRGNKFPAPLTHDTMAAALHEAHLRLVTDKRINPSTDSEETRRWICGLRLVRDIRPNEPSGP